MQNSNTLLRTAILLFCSLAFSQGHKLAPALNSLVEAERAFAQYSVEHGQREAFLKFFAEDGVAFNPRPFNSNEYLRQQPPTPKPQPFILNWQPLYADISAAGDLGFTTGPYSVTAAGRPTRHGIYFSVWKKQADNAWKVVADIGVPTPEAIAPLTTDCAAATHASAKPAKTELAQLLSLDSAFARQLKTDGAPQAYARYVNAESRLHRVGQMPVVGSTAITQYLTQQNPSLSFSPEKADIASSGDLGYVYGSYESPPEKGYYLRVWRREGAGKWVLMADIANPFPPEKK
jgi:ketosteroid isomerase-like protein